ncbi:MAG: CPBP family intramembrane metalloprotease [Anaerolineae bacterium]|nr:CPBP family intramembrane metalloprotease [Anaerolineae bacterium]
MLNGIRQTSWWVIGLFYIAHIALALFINFVIFPSGLTDPIQRATGGLINATLLANFINLALIVFGILVILGKQRARDLGLIWRHLPGALLLTLLIWLVAQAVLVLLALAQGQPLALHPNWNQRGTTIVLGVLIGQVFGNALYEEISFRGFLLPQLYFKINARPRLLIALLISQALFALMHIPNRLAFGATLAEAVSNLPMLLLLGILFALFYLVTGSIFLSIGVHALGNAATPLFASGADPSLITYLVALVVLLILVARQRLTARRPAAMAAAH